MQEKLMNAGAEASRILRDSGGQFFVEEGHYSSLEEAEARMKALSDTDIELNIEERGADESPRSIP
jgi:hypothetical protein